MSSPFRTVGVGLAVVAVCVLLSTMSWLQVLLAFVIAALGWSLWSWLADLELRRKQRRWQARREQNLKLPGKYKPERAGNIYQFPVVTRTGRERQS